MIDRKLKQALRASVLTLSDAALTYLREEVQREQSRRRLQVRERRRAKQQGERNEAMRVGAAQMEAGC